MLFCLGAFSLTAAFAAPKRSPQPTPAPQVQVAPPAEVPVVRRPAPFPEETKRELWDAGCADWPEGIEHLKIRSRKSGGDLRVYTRLVMAPERGESVAEAMESAAHLLGEERSYPSWVMPGINEAPDGGRYFVTVEELKPEKDLVDRHSMVTGAFQFKVLWFERTGRTSLIFKEEAAPIPDCPSFASLNAKERGAARRFLYRMIPREDLLERLVGEIFVYPVGDHVEARLRVVARPARIVYELLPETMFRAQLGARGRRIWENFADFRRLVALSKLSSVGPATSSKAAGPRAKGD